MTKLDNIKDVKVGEQEIEIDPRSKNTANKAYNYIGTGGPADRSSRSRCSASRKEKKI
jgi:hypothetical protein